MKRLAGRLFALLSSFGLAVVVLAFLLLLTYLGTKEQAHSSLFEVQQKYFESLVVHHDVFGVPVPLPGVYLLLVLLAVNLIAGGVVRIRKSTATIGVLICHAGILLMLVGGLVEYQYSIKGQMTLHENGVTGPVSSDEFKSYHEWEITVSEERTSGPVTELVIPAERFITLDGDATATFTSAEMPFDLTVSRVSKNSTVVPASRTRPGDGPVVDGYALRPVAQGLKAEADVAGFYVSIAEKGSGARHDAILWGRQLSPFGVDVGGRRWNVDVDRMRWKVPFTIVLDDFRKEMHPGTRMPAKFESDVTRLAGDTEERVNISMNRPLRHGGYTFFQSSWGPADSRPGEPLFSTFAVVKNPADDLPLISCIVIGLGLLVHFCRKLVLHILKQSGSAA